MPLGKICAKAPGNLKNEPWPHLRTTQERLAKEVARVAHDAGKTARRRRSFTDQLAPKGEGATMTLAWGDKSLVTWTSRPAK